MDSGSPDIFVLAPRSFPQERARRTYEALLDAAVRVFSEKGFDAAQTPDIAAEAGVSVGTFYRYFDDKREVFLEVMQIYLQEGHREVMRGLSPEKFIGKERDATVEHTLHVLLEQCLRSPKLEAVFTSMALRDAEVAKLRRRIEEASCDKLAELIGQITTRDQVPDPAATAYVVHTAVVECALRIAGLRGQTPVSRERALRALGQLVTRAVFGTVA